MIVTRSRVYLLTAISAALFIVLGLVFGEEFFFAPLFHSEYATEGTWLNWLLLAIIIGAGVMQAQKLGDEEINLKPERSADTPGQVQDPAFWRLALGNVNLAILWLPIRFFVGREWLVAGEHKVRSDAWMDGGQALMGYWTGATTINEETGTSRIPYGWFHDFLTYMLNNEWYTWFAKLIAVGELMVGLGLLFGTLVGIAAFFGSFLNFNFLLAGTVSTNPVLFGLTVFLILAWKVAGHFGLDRWLLPALGTPWQRLSPNREDQMTKQSTITPQRA